MVTPSSRTARKVSSGKYARGKYARAISDRSGLEYPYNEMVREWTGALVQLLLQLLEEYQIKLQILFLAHSVQQEYHTLK